MTKLKAEFLQHYYENNRIPLRTLLIANITKFNQLGSVLPFVTNFIFTNKVTSYLLKKSIGFAPQRSIPTIYKVTLKAWVKRNIKTNGNTKKKVYLFADEFTDYNDTEIGIKAVRLLIKLGYDVEIPNHTISGRTYLSKGLLKKAKKIAIKNVTLLKDIISEENPLIGIEPSGILSFRDEYTELVDENLKEASLKIKASAFMFDEFIVSEIKKGNIKQTDFTNKNQKIKLHGHCHQKALVSVQSSVEMLSFPKNFEVEEIKSGCCGMAGAFGYEKEHYDFSMKVGNMVLFPEIKKSPDYIISAPGTSCRHQIKDGTGRDALHPIEILFDALV